MRPAQAAGGECVMAANARRATVIITLLAAILAVMHTPEVAAQTVSGRFLGAIRDQQGAVVPNATVTARNTGTGAERAAVADSSGGFTISSVPAGTYEVTAKAAGFETAVRNAVELTVGAAVRVDFSLTVGVVEQQV